MPPITVARLEYHLDFVAGLMVRFPDRAALLVPIWRRLERERDAMAETAAIIAAAHDRANKLLP